MSIVFRIANEHNCFKILFSICIDNFEQYFDTSLPITQNDLQNFVNNSKVFTPLKNNKLKLSVIYGFTSMVCDKKAIFSTLRYSCFSPLLNILEIDGVYCFVKLHPLRQTELFQRRYKVYVRSHRRRIVVETTSCVHVVNSDL